MRRFALLVAAVACALGLLVAVAPAASAHVVPTSSVALQVGEDTITAVVAIPVSDLVSTTGIDLGDGSQAEVDAHADKLRAYLLEHFAPQSDDGQPWAVTAGPLTVVQAGDRATTGLYQQLQVRFTLTPPDGGSLRSFDLGYDVVVDRVATHVIVVTVSSDWAGGQLSNARQIGVIKRDTVSGEVQPLHVDLGAGSAWRGFTSMISTGMAHIAEGTDHQLFLLTLLLPAPLLARGRRWAGAVTARATVRRILSVTAAFTVGHSITLALGALGVPVPQQAVEALIAVSILVAAAHALRPLFPGREAFVAAGFGLVHGLAFSAVLRQLDLSGTQLVLSLLGFNLGIEAMQLIIVAAVLPPLVLLARAGRYRTFRMAAAVATGAAAAGWLAERLGTVNLAATLADRLGTVAVPTVTLLWVAGLALTLVAARKVQQADRGSAPTGADGVIQQGGRLRRPQELRGHRSPRPCSRSTSPSAR